MLVAQASGAKVKSFWLSVYNYGNGVNIGHPVTVGMAFRVTDIVTELR